MTELDMSDDIAGFTVNRLVYAALGVRILSALGIPRELIFIEWMLEKQTRPLFKRLLRRDPRCQSICIIGCERPKFDFHRSGYLDHAAIAQIIDIGGGVSQLGKYLVGMFAGLRRCCDKRARCAGEGDRLAGEVLLTQAR